MENWKDIVDFPNYEVSDLGNVRNKRNKFVLKPREDKATNKYTRYIVNISKDGGKQLNRKVHRLVAEAFIPKVEGKDEVDHIDRNPANNAVTNLRWATRAENCKNTGIRSDNTTGERNIYFNKERNKWQVKYMVNGKEKYCGAYLTLEDAKLAKAKFSPH